MSNFGQRTLTGFFFVILLIVGILWHPISFFGLFLVVEILALREFYIIAQKSNSFPQKYFGSVVGALLFIFAFVGHFFDIGNSLSLLLIPVVSFIFIFELYRDQKHPILNIATTLFGLVYVSLPLMLLNQIVYMEGSFNGKILLGIFILIWASDTGGYLFGVTFGKHRLFERISPKKSWEGFIGSIFVSQIIAYLIASYFESLDELQWVGYLNWTFIAAIIAIFGTLGDLVESMIKRSVGIKDSSNILPGHGGILDRFDSLLFTIPIIFTYLYFLLSDYMYN